MKGKVDSVFAFISYAHAKNLVAVTTAATTNNNNNNHSKRKETIPNFPNKIASF
jgi:hypothetical protein